VVFSVLTLWVKSVSADWGALNMPVGVTPVSREVYDLHMLILWVCIVIGILVFGAMFYSIYHHRKSRGAVAAQFHESTTLELAWTLVPFLILVVMAIPATRVLIAMENTSQSEMTIKITGYQWKWKYDYLDEDISFFSTLSTPREQLYDLEEKDEHYLLEVDNHLILPVNTKIRLLTTAADVIHAWWVPDLGWKRDAIPGYINDNWTYIEKEGTYRGQCTELCGKDHGFMPVVVEAVSKV
jgi:cytochrome c oxidase subunit 2